MNRLFAAASLYLVLGLGAGLYYREFTKTNEFPAGEYTQLAVAHTHLLALGFLVLLIALALEKVFTLSASPLFSWFLWVYNVGVLLSSAMMVWHGSLTVLGEQAGGMIAGIAGLGHIITTAGFVLQMLALRSRITADRPATVDAQPSSVAG